MSIHQESVIAALPEQVFELLTTGSLFSSATGLPAEITDREGDPFLVFGGRVEGRQVELVPGRRGRAGVAFWRCSPVALGARRLLHGPVYPRAGR